MKPGPVLKPHGGYRDLEAFKTTEIIYDGTVAFCRRYFRSRDKITDQMVGAARGGRQNIAEGSIASGTSARTELYLVNVARASLEELLLDYEDFLRNNSLNLWEKCSPKAIYIRKLATSKPKVYDTYRVYVETKSPETAANTMITLIRQACYLLDRLKATLEQQFLEGGGFSERLYAARASARRR